MTKPGGWHHSPETRAQITATMRARRTEISEATKLRMADPAVRQRIKDGMAEASGEAAEIHLLRAAWKTARRAVRTRFIAELFAAACEAPK